jgi:hypothetical protein
MSATGTGPFENDGALDLCDELRDRDGDGVRDLLRSALVSTAEFDENEYLEKDEAEAAVAAAAIVVARQAGDWATLQSEGLDVLASADLDDLVEVAAAALRRVMGDESELNSLWADTVYHDEWLARLEAMLTRDEPSQSVAGGPCRRSILNCR